LSSKNNFNLYKNERFLFYKKNTEYKQSFLGKYYKNRLTLQYKYLIPEGSKVLDLGCGDGIFLSNLKPSVGVGIDFTENIVEDARKKFPKLKFISGDVHEIELGDIQFDFIVLSDLVNDIWDIQDLLIKIRPYCNDHTRLIFNFYSRIWGVPLSIARFLKLAKPVALQNWLTPHDVHNLLEISGYEPIRSWGEFIFPVPIPFLSNFINRYFPKLPLFQHLCLTNFIVARPLLSKSDIKPTVSVIIAARNESGHIQDLIDRVPMMGGKNPEVIFVEGNSTDDTYSVIERLIRGKEGFKLLKQPGKGKGDAVRAGFEIATGDILMILDADITVSPEDLPKFYELIENGKGEFINGVRLVYPMDKDAMRFANLVGNKFFSWAFSWLLSQPIRDTLCGTKVLKRSDYLRIAENRLYFGDFDPFGDFDLIFGAAKLNLKIVEVPIRYGSRIYGETNISRWTHGWLLLEMVIFAARRMKFI
jgi:2-polyprenyl-3-methyl-5-hydroxy-6-metoxy-1,4-benzoquinol methylase